MHAIVHFFDYFPHCILPVAILLAFRAVHLGTQSPMKIDRPSTSRLRGLFRSTYCRLDSPTAMISPVDNIPQL